MDLYNNIMNIMNTIEYGFKDENGVNLIKDTDKCDNEFYRFYYLLDPQELLERKCGVCWDQVELERYLFHNKYKVFMYKYERPNYHISCDEFYKYIKTQYMIKADEYKKF